MVLMWTQNSKGVAALPPPEETRLEGQGGKVDAGLDQVRMGQERPQFLMPRDKQAQGCRLLTSSRKLESLYTCPDF